MPDAPIDPNADPTTLRSMPESVAPPAVRGFGSRRAPGETPLIQLGAMNFGGRTAEAEATRIVRRALDLGIELFDTANAYNDGNSERILGKALGADRARVGVATKVGFGRTAGKPEGLSAPVVKGALEESLGRLGMDFVDVYYLHVPDPRTPIEETLQAMASVLERGHAKAWGISNYASWQVLEMMHLAPSFGLPPPVIGQHIYNVLIRQLDVEYGRFAGQYGLATCVYNPLAGGLLSGKHQKGEVPKDGRFGKNPFYQRRYLHDVMFDHVTELAEVAKAEELSLVDLSYAWLSHRPVVDQVIVGPGSIEHLEAAHAGLQKRLSAGALKRIDEIELSYRGTDTNYAR